MKKLLICILLSGCTFIANDKDSFNKDTRPLKKLTTEYYSWSSESINVCRDLHEMYLKMTDLSSGKNITERKKLAIDVLKKVTDCSNKFKIIKKNRFELRSIVFSFFKTEYENTNYSAEKKQSLEKLKYDYASLQASIQITEKEIPHYLKPVNVHAKYISQKGLPNDKELLKKEKDYVNKRYEILIYELSLINKFSKLLKKSLAENF